MNKNSVLYPTVFALLLLVTSVTLTNLTNIHGQDEEGDIDTDNEITSQLGPEVLANGTVPFTQDQNGTSLINPSEPGVEGLDNFTSPLENQSLLSEDESIDTGNESLLSEDESIDTGNESLLSEQGVEDEFENETITTETGAPPVDNTSELALEDGGDVISQSQQGVTSEIDQRLENVAAATLGLTNVTAEEENEQMTNVQQV